MGAVGNLGELLSRRPERPRRWRLHRGVPREFDASFWTQTRGQFETHNLLNESIGITG